MDTATAENVTQRVETEPQNTHRKTLPAGMAAKRWKAGQSGNAGGRPRVPDDVRRLARGYTESALRRLAVLAGLSDEKDKLIKTAASPAVQLAAAVALLDRAWGRPEASLNVSGVMVGANGLASGEAEMLIDAIRAEMARRAAAEAAIPSTATALPAPQMAESPETPTDKPNAAE